MSTHIASENKGIGPIQPQARHILEATRLGADPGYYAGRSASLGDVDGVILTQLRRGIEAHYGTHAADQFDKLIEGTTYLSASNIISGTIRLASAGWIYHPHARDGGPDRTARHAGTEGQAFAVLASAMFRSGSFGDRDETPAIRKHYAAVRALNRKSPTRENWKQVRES